MLCPHVCTCTMCMLFTHEGQKREVDSLELELQRVLSYSWDFKLGPWEEQQVLATTEPSLQPQITEFESKLSSLTGMGFTRFPSVTFCHSLFYEFH